MYVTEVLWEPDATNYEPAVLRQKATELHPEAEFRSTMTVTDQGKNLVCRSWDTVELAQQWIDFVTQFNPISAVITTPNA